VSSTSLSVDYQIGEVLGVGTVGTIYHALDRRTGHAVAIKKLHPTVSADRLIRARFRREMLILDRLQHPNIIRYYGGGEEDGLLYYVMEYVDGGTVKELLETDGPLPWPVVVEVGRQLCSALQFAHNHGVIHRDLKPSNLFLTTDGVVKLGDFGIARDMENVDITTSGMTVGTHAYMAPEQIRGDTGITGKADLYSLGCCLFELLAGRTPFVGDHFAQLFDQHLKSPPPSAREFCPECPVELDEIIQRMLAKAPQDRPFNARQIQAVMLKLDESIDPQVAAVMRSELVPAPGQVDVGSESVTAESHLAHDAATAKVTAVGRAILQTRIQQRLSRVSSRDVAWAPVAIILSVVVALIVLAAVLRS
jgi:serine/threonine protein kinase